MALWGAKTCPLCGKEYKGLGTPCKGGSYCGECRKKVHVLIPDDDAEFMTVAEIRAKLEEGAEILAVALDGHGRVVALVCEIVQKTFYCHCGYEDTHFFGNRQIFRRFFCFSFISGQKKGAEGVIRPLRLCFCRVRMRAYCRPTSLAGRYLLLTTFCPLRM